MAVAARAELAAPPGECRRCRTYCDKLIEPSDCLKMRCPYLWSYIDGSTGRRFMGCVQKVFRGELDVQLFEAAERNGGFGGLKMTGEPLPQCQTRVEPSLEGGGPAHTCVNPEFFDCVEPDTEFDLRDQLTQRRAA
ncbi:MAG: hypothetical protein JJE23_09850 [Thermoleophilia bacterium]|jgi:hypothetical protein|nr:hypothetical protein [Thermoleophilia bacterium]